MASSGATSRRFAAGSFRFAFEADHDSDGELLNELFADLPEPDEGVPLSGTYKVRRVPGSSPLEWMIDGPRLEQQPSLELAAMLTRLMSAVNLAALDLEPQSLHLHAAAAALDGRAAVIAAEQNTGKTTTVSHLVERGWSFITDETVRVSEVDHSVHGFAKPLSIKPGGGSFVQHLIPAMIPPYDAAMSSFHFVAVGSCGGRVASTATPAVTVLLRRDPSGSPTEPTEQAIPAADAVVALMQNTLDAERHGRAVERLARLVAAAPCFEVTAGTPAATAALVERLTTEARSEVATTVIVHGPSASISPEVASVAVGGRAVVHHQGTGQVFALDAAGTRVWEQLGGWSDHGIDLAGIGVSSLVSQLASLGVLSGTAVGESSSTPPQSGGS